MKEVQRAAQIGDQLQSEADRLADFILNYLPSNEGVVIPYEVQMAALAVRDLNEDWTELRQEWNPYA